MRWVELGPVAAIPARGARVVHLGGEPIAVFRAGDGRVFALRDRCPHRGGPLSQGIVHGYCVTCPLHDWVIDLATGEALGPDAGRTVVHDVRVEDGRVYIDAAPRGPATSDDHGAAGDCGRSQEELRPGGVA